MKEETDKPKGLEINCELKNESQKWCCLVFSVISERLLEGLSAEKAFSSCISVFSYFTTTTKKASLPFSGFPSDPSPQYSPISE